MMRSRRVPKRLGFMIIPILISPWSFGICLGHRVILCAQRLRKWVPFCLSRLLELTEAQEGILNIAFRIADEQGYPLLDLKDLQSVLVWLGEHRADVSLRYGNISVASIGAIQRRLMVLENQGATHLFGEPALELPVLMQVDAQGWGHINILAADKLMASPRLYASFLLWLLSELFETLPEVGDPDKPKLVFFFDEAHLLFDDAPKSLVDKVEQVARLIRSKGVGVYFVTQNPADVPEDILVQLGDRVQHGLRAYTAKDQRALRLAAETYAIIRALTLRTPFYGWAWVRRLRRSLKKRVCPELLSAPRSARRPVSWVQSRLMNGRGV